MFSNEVLIGLGGLVLSVLTYFAGVLRTKKQLERSEREVRITRVMESYLANARSGHTAEYDGLMRAGIVTLRDDGEIRDLCERIVKHGEKHPLGRKEPLLREIDLHLFFSIAVSENVNFFRVDLNGLIERVKAIQEGQKQRR